MTENPSWGRGKYCKVPKVLVIFNVLYPPPYIILNLLDKATERETS